MSGSERLGRTTRILTMTFPYCDPCAKRANREKVRAVVVGILACAAALALALAAWRLHVAIGAPIRFAVALPLGMAVAALLALVTRPSLPPPPATARGGAVIVKGTDGTVLCTNPRFAELLAQANGVAATPGKHRDWLGAPLLALACGLLVLSVWIKAGGRADTTVPSASAPVVANTASPPAPTPPQQPTARPRKPAPAPASPARKR
jgi:hypothetical protein